MDNDRKERIIAMQWKKIGLIFRPDTRFKWMQTHAALPVANHINGDIFRIYFSSRDKQNRSHIGYFEIDITNPLKILNVSKEPVLAPGPLGYFDDHGVYASSVVRHEGRLYMYYIGWNPGLTPPLFYSSIGLAISEDGGKTFIKHSKVPILTRSEYDPCLVTSPFVLKEEEKWHMWYISGYRWKLLDGVPQSYYHIKYAESIDGIKWIRKGVVCIDHQSKEEKNIARPCVIKEGDLYRTWYSFDRGEGYRIGYAESSDGIYWTRKDKEAGIDVSHSGWDSNALAYPWVFSHKGRKYMFYNGNNFGKDGIGLAIGS